MTWHEQSDVSAVKMSLSVKRKNCRCHYQTTVKNAKRKHFSGVILSNCHNPCVLFRTIICVLNAPQTNFIDSSSAACEDFPHFYIDQIASTRASI